MLAEVRNTTGVNVVPRLRVRFLDNDQDLRNIRECSLALEEVASKIDQTVDRHQWNNVLNVATLSLDALYYQLESGRTDCARKSLFSVKAAIREVENLFGQ